MKDKIRHVFFDLDHTLWDFDKNSGLTFEKIFKLNGLEVELSTFLEVYEPINLNYWKLYREEKVTKSALRYGRLKDAFNAINVDVEDDMINHLSVAYIDYLTTFNHLFEGALDILNYLRDKYELHIITNGFDEAQERKMHNSNIRNYFKTITNSEMVGVKKPNPRIFNFALDSANANPDESVMIGDSLEADIEGAHNIGMETIYFDYRNLNNSNGYKRVTTLKSIENYL
ncbi:MULTISPECIES: YjjG family noncanonical pyrimidine nucleotidase [Winogradskyella]|jgi:putative hydrolase of the HAD superfamily|uniref:YjjG family noncanonical pyrimidine nucleotidase n=1 Tax=Winogradskyella TaxID=286104 RepID=UPI000C66D496|nr:YjjG family noncanonical pyrimidine nucleotidase [Winogradskyella sp. MH6]MBD09462.1 noncanonical pyrimidine nucleotidase, YjjG family [Flavobacteriaceae bacterium]|tara:strand:+ start:1923 stop:2609 length:687 start_codon:yes stop_codon:yes gene_type:complete